MADSLYITCNHCIHVSSLEFGPDDKNSVVDKVNGSVLHFNSKPKNDKIKIGHMRCQGEIGYCFLYMTD